MSVIKLAAAARLVVLGAWLGATCAVTLGQTGATAPEIYTCIDAKGRKLTSDRRIADCVDREQRQLNPSGTVKAVIPPTLTAQEQHQLELKQRAQQEERARQEEEKKRDRALLIRYPNQAVHDRERAEALANVAVVQRTAAARIVELQTERAKLTDEMAFYKKDASKVPAKLRRQIAEVDENIAAQKRFLNEQNAEVGRINTRFDAELLRLKPQW